MPILPILFFLVIITAIALVALSFRKKRIPKLTTVKAIPDSSPRYEFISHSKLWESMEHPELFNRLERDFYKAGVKSVYLLHGTFVGEDPFHVAALLERSFPNLRPEVIRRIRKKIKQGQNLMAKDLGNFVDEHIALFESILACQIFNFSWSSANHHYARLEGCLNLVDHLAARHENDDRVLLIGHSHAGQIFAILTQLFFNEEMRLKIHELYPERDLIEKLAVIQKLKFDFVTLGTPARYPWFLGENMRLLHFINHRGPDLLGGSFKDAIFTRKGDYIQQWGISGSDMRAGEQEIRKINNILDPFLGAGSNMEILRKKIPAKNRLHTDGFHLLVDYGDNSRLPNFVKTAFGHGTYTRLKYMPFLLGTIREKFYLETLTE